MRWSCALKNRPAVLYKAASVSGTASGGGASDAGSPFRRASSIAARVTSCFANFLNSQLLAPMRAVLRNGKFASPAAGAGCNTPPTSGAPTSCAHVPSLNMSPWRFDWDVASLTLSSRPWRSSAGAGAGAGSSASVVVGMPPATSLRPEGAPVLLDLRGLIVRRAASDPILQPCWRCQEGIDAEGCQTKR